MKDILDEEIQESTFLPPRTLPKYMVRWHGLLSLLLLLNGLIIIGSASSNPAGFFQGALLTYAFICFISGLHWLNRKINTPLAFSFVLLCLSNLAMQLVLLGNGLFTWMIATMGGIAAP